MRYSVMQKETRVSKGTVFVMVGIGALHSSTAFCASKGQLHSVRECGFANVDYVVKE